MSDLPSRLTDALQDQYAIERKLGEGGMATVYLADDLKHERKVALKVLKPELAAVVGAERFLAEIKTTANLQHPHILPLFDSGEAGGFLYYVMPYVEGETLREQLDGERQLPVDQAVRMVQDLAEALDYAHQHGVIHRDIKPGNILMQQGRPVISDFGLALAAGSAGGTRLTETGLSVGTPYYMSPEQATGDRVVGPQSDLYALACVLFEALVGEPPYPGSTAQAVLGKIIAGGPVSATEQRRSVPAHVDAAIRRALEKLPADRFATAAEFGKALGDTSFRHGTAGSAGTTADAGPWRGLALAASATVVVLLGAMAWMTGPAEAPPPEWQRIDLGSGFTENNSFTVAMFSALSPDGSAILYGDTVGSLRGATGPQLHYKQAGEAYGAPVPGLELAISPTFSPDGEWILYIDGEATLRKQPLSGGASVALLETQRGANNRPALAWLDDGTIVLENMGDYAVLTVSDDGGTADTISTEDVTGRPLRATGLPGGGGALLIGCQMDGRGSACPPGTPVLFYLDLERDTVIRLREGVNGAWPGPAGHVIYSDAGGSVYAAEFDRRAGTLGPPTPLLDGVTASPNAAEMHVSANGTLLYRRGPATGASASGTRPYWLSPGGGLVPVDEGFMGGAMGEMALSPDGTRLAMSMSRPDQAERIWVKDLPSGPPLPLTPPELDTQRPVWSTDGTRLLYIASDSLGNAHVQGVAADGSSPAPDTVYYDETDDVFEVHATGDPQVIVIRRGNTAANADIGIVDLRDGSYTPFAATPATENGMALSPDGRWLAYVTNQSGQREVVVQPFPEGGARIQVSSDGGTEPQWTADGQALIYRDTELWITRATVTTDPTFRVQGTERLANAALYASAWTHRMYQVSPDGTRFMVRGSAIFASAGDGDLILVRNWFTEVLERIGG
jgi:serine/threonine-protein kinase